MEDLIFDDFFKAGQIECRGTFTHSGVALVNHTSTLSVRIEREFAALNDIAFAVDAQSFLCKPVAVGVSSIVFHRVKSECLVCNNHLTTVDLDVNPTVERLRRERGEGEEESRKK